MTFFTVQMTDDRDYPILITDSGVETHLDSEGAAGFLAAMTDVYHVDDVALQQFLDGAPFLFERFD